ncbi:MAG TPA: lytic transglycosylase domain-containing protein, partial [Candidatus Binataceae bacterium]|nr:lytic transglycosylase domain-containing protein [Candidatus Binataceae bacterium]
QGNLLRLPLTIDYLALGAAFNQQFYTDHGRADLWNGSDRCQYLYAENPRFGRAGDNVKLESDGHLMLGVMMGDNCVSPVVWNGIIETEAQPYMAPHLKLQFRVSDINLLDANHQKTLLAGRGFDLIKQYYIEQFQTFSFDLSPAFEQFEELVKAGAPPEVAERVAQTLATLRAEPELLATDDGIRATLDLTVPAFAPVPTPAAPTQLTPQELAAFQDKIDQWDAFLVFAIKQMGETSKDQQLRDDLLALLIDSRHRLVDALANPQSGGPDPIRLLFLDEWQRLGEIVRDAVRRGTLGSQSLQFLSFVSAGDALFALDQAAPALGMRISSDDLRRLAHMIGPGEKNPLAFGFDEDPELRKMFKVKEPLSSEGPLETEVAIVATPTETTSSNATAAPSASATPSPIPSPTPYVTRGLSEMDLPPEDASPSPAGPTMAPTPTPFAIIHEKPSTSSWDAPLRWLTPREAEAADAPAKVDPLAKLQQLAKKLKRVIVSSGNATEYRGDYEALLNFGAQHEIADDNLDYRFRPLYMRLVKATAWQESCWRQFVLDGNRVTYLESSTHDLGLMQVNKYVWRGFYNVDRLEWDVLYNASAGMQILAQLLDDTEIKRGAFTPSHPDELARSIYAAYNGGPGAYRRWRVHETKQLRQIDDSFWAKYQAVAQGQQIDILSCEQNWASTH